MLELPLISKQWKTPADLSSPEEDGENASEPSGGDTTSRRKMSRVLITTLRNAFLHKPLQIWAAGVFCKASVSMQIAGLQSDVFGGRNAGEARKEKK